MSRGHRRAGLAATLLAAAVTLAGCGGQAATPSLPELPAAAPGPATTPAAGAPGPAFEVERLPRQVGVPGPVAPPARVVIPAIGVDSTLVRLGLGRDGAMEVPSRFEQAGWFAPGTPPGQPGPAVIAGHVDSRQGPAVFYRLGRLRVGDRVDVVRTDGVRLHFRVEERRQYAKSAFPTSAVFGPVPWAALRLVTCGGSFDRASGHYRDNVVVNARLTGFTAA